MPTQSALKVIGTSFDQCAVQLIARYHLIDIATWTHRQADTHTHIHTRVYMFTHTAHTHAHTRTRVHAHTHTQTDVNSKT